MSSMTDKLESIKVYLKNGLIFEGKYYPDDYEAIYNVWRGAYNYTSFNSEKRYLTFTNGEILLSEVAGIEWGG